MLVIYIDSHKTSHLKKALTKKYEKNLSDSYQRPDKTKKLYCNLIG